MKGLQISRYPLKACSYVSKSISIWIKYWTRLYLYLKTVFLILLIKESDGIECFNVGLVGSKQFISDFLGLLFDY